MEVKFYSTEETLSKIENLIENNEIGCYLRFGDGDVCLATGVSELLQSTNKTLKEMMIDVMNLKHPNVLRTLPLHNKETGTLEEGMFPGNHESPLEWCEDILRKFTSVTKEESVELYTNVALSHVAVTNPERASSFLRKINPKVKYFIGNENIPFEILTKLYGEKVVHIKTPSSNSFSSFEKIYKEFVELVGNDREYSVVVTSMGCSGRPMQKRIWDNYNNFFLFDFGSLMDALCGWETRAWIELTKFDRNKFLEYIGSN